ncbi:unnamed protein product [Microthlaspi erraticum]|uniref:BTB domain-containing protein n=1 Tax=Microthlaspi erraticum TaxID=1685480 RepID=A0A6D2KMQ4_9BRAS|nr:unnamed protein product [Microthlaspi erraticum]
MATTLTNKELFWDGIAKIFTEKQADVRLKPCDDKDEEAAIFAHKILLSARSKVFKMIFESDKFKASSMMETVTVEDLNHEELVAFVEFLYSDGAILSGKAKKHVVSLYRAAHKYEIPHLGDLCRYVLISSLRSCNALKVLALSEIPSDDALCDAALKVIKTHKSTISTSAAFKEFAVLHPVLTVKIMKAISLKRKPCVHCQKCKSCDFS